ncbi:MAG TPA: hypothetical protein VFC39_01060 [Acidobacteriaceae bacterium]|nr:hypothetical protein [Acidobacteriaceae bacterium]
MMRVRWFRGEWPVSIRALADRLRERTFTESSSDGFLLDRTRDSFIEGRYIERFEFDHVESDPFGRKSTSKRVAHNQVRFVLYDTYPQIELRGVPHDTHGFVSRLIEAGHFKVMTAPVNVDLLRWSEAIRQYVGQEVIVDGMHLSDVELAPSVQSAMRIQGREDVRAAVIAIVGSRRFTVDKIRMKWGHEGRPMAVTLTNEGAARIEEGGLEAAALVRSLLADAVGMS